MVDTVYVPPLYPSSEFPDEEARCEICRDTGWVHPLKPDGKADYSTIKPCQCQRKALLHQYADTSGVPEEKRSKCFENFVPTIPPADFNAITNFAQGKASFKLLLIFGDTGNGKTHLAYSAVVEACKRGVAAKYIEATKMFLAVRAMYDNERRVEDPAERFKACPFLVIDDVGGEKETDWTRAMLEEIIDHRYSHELCTMVTTNKSPTNLPEPVQSRFKDSELSRVIHNAAPDYRPKKRGGK